MLAGRGWDRLGKARAAPGRAPPDPDMSRKTASHESRRSEMRLTRREMRRTRSRWRCWRSNVFAAAWHPKISGHRKPTRGGAAGRSFAAGAAPTKGAAGAGPTETVDRRAEGGAPGAASSRPSSCGGSARPQTATGRLSAAANGDALASRAPGGGAQAKASACSSAAAVTASGSRWRTAGAAAASVFAASASRVENGSCQLGLAKGFRKRLLKKEAAYWSSRREAERPTDAMNGRCMLARTVGQPQMVISPGDGAGRRCAPGHRSSGRRGALATMEALACIQHPALRSQARGGQRSVVPPTVRCRAGPSAAA